MKTILHMKSKVTIKDVAQRVGVSPSTVSNALSGKRPISASVCRQIREAADALGYRPNYFASSIKQQKSMLIGLLVGECRNPATANVVHLLSSELKKHSYEVVLGLAGDDPALGKGVFRKFTSGLVDGIINLLTYISPDEAERLSCRIPVVTYIRQPDAMVYIDYAAGVRQALDFLYGQGHQRIGYIASYYRTENREDPGVAGYETFCSHHKIPFDPRLIVYSESDTTSGRYNFPKLWEQGVTAVICCNDMTAIGVYQYAHQHGIRIPEDLSVIGFDNSAVAVWPSLSSLEVWNDEIAEFTVRSLLMKIRKEQCPPTMTKVIVPRLIVRDSVQKRQKS